MNLKKKFLAKNKFMYYYSPKKESEIQKLIIRTLLIFFLFCFAFPLSLFADVKSDLAEDYRLKGFEAQQQGKWDEALSFYIKAAAISPKPAVIYNDIGVVYERLGLLRKAERNYLEAIRSDDKFLASYSNLAFLYETQDDFEKAAEYLKKRVQWGDPDDPWTVNAKIRLYDLAESYPKLKDWLKLQEIQELHESITQEIRDDFNKQVAEAKKYHKEGQDLARQKKYSQAIVAFNRALSFTPQNPKILEDRNKALLHYTQEQVKRHTDLALKWLELGDTVSAQIEFRKALAIIPNEPIQISK